MQEIIQQLEKKRAAARLGGGEKRIAAQHAKVQWWLQAKGPDTARLMTPGGSPLQYTLPDFGLTMPFKPTDFTQVNPYINAVLVSRALRLLGVQTHERVIDWFCGLGNFTLPLATGKFIRLVACTVGKSNRLQTFHCKLSSFRL